MYKKIGGQRQRRNSEGEKRHLINRLFMAGKISPREIRGELSTGRHVNSSSVRVFHGLIEIFDCFLSRARFRLIFPGPFVRCQPFSFPFLFSPAWNFFRCNSLIKKARSNGNRFIPVRDASSRRTTPRGGTGHVCSTSLRWSRGLFTRPRQYERLENLFDDETVVASSALLPRWTPA